MSRLASLPLWAAALLALPTFSCSRAEDAPRPVVLISIDSLRADYTTPYGHVAKFAPEIPSTPFLQELADDGLLFEHASAPSPWTLPSHMTLLTAMNPGEHGVRSRKYSLSPNIDLVSDRFQAAGYHTGGFFSAPFLHPAWGFGRGFDLYIPSADYLGTIAAGTALAAKGKSDEVVAIHHQSHTDNETGAQVVDRALAWLEQDGKHEEPFFLFLHFWDPHYDYFPPKEYAEMFHPGYDGDVVGDELMKGDLEVPIPADDMDHLKALYEAEIRYTDDQIRRLFDRLEELGVENPVVAIVSDHGDEFDEHGYRGHHWTLYEEVMHVPMVLHAPGLIPAGKRIPASVSIRDVAPTLMDLAGLPAWTDRSGLSLRPLWEGQEQDREVSMDLLRPAKRMQMLGYRYGMRKGIQDVPTNTFTTYDLSVDPLELSPSVGKITADDPFARGALEFLTAVQESRHKVQKTVEAAEITDLLAEVGYAESEAPPQPEE